MNHKALFCLFLNLCVSFAIRAGEPFEIQHYLSYIVGSVIVGACCGYAYDDFVIKPLASAHEGSHNSNPEKAMLRGAVLGGIASATTLALLWGIFDGKSEGKSPKFWMSFMSMLTAAVAIVIADYFVSRRHEQSMWEYMNSDDFNPSHLGWGALGGLLAAIGGGVAVKICQALPRVPFTAKK